MEDSAISNITHKLNYTNNDGLLYKEIAFMGIHFGSSHASACHVVLLVSVRCYVTVRPINYRCVRPSSIVKISLILWLISCVIGVSYFFLRRELCGGSAISLVLSIRAYLLVIPLIIIIISQYRIIKALRNSLRDMTSDCTRLTLLTTIIGCVYLLSAILYPLCLLLEHKCEEEHLCYMMFILARILWLVNSSVNPLLYFLFSERIYNWIKSKFITTERTAV